MSIHSTLKIAAKGAQQRSVLTRIERIKNLMEKDLWPKGRNVTGLPKLKILRVKFKKEKVEKAATEGQAAAAGAVAAPGAAVTAGAEQKAAKGTEQKAAKGAEQKAAKQKEK